MRASEVFFILLGLLVLLIVLPFFLVLVLVLSVLVLVFVLLVLLLICSPSMPRPAHGAYAGVVTGNTSKTDLWHATSLVVLLYGTEKIRFRSSCPA